MGDFSKTINLKKKKKKKLLCAFLCLSLGLKKPGDFTVFEGHGYPLVWLNFCRDGHHFFHIFLWMIVTLAKNKNSRKKKKKTAFWENPKEIVTFQGKKF